MTYIVKDRVAISLSFGDEVFNLERNFVSLQISSGINMGLPACRLVVTDELAFFKKMWTISDGNAFEINLGSTQENAVPYKFLIFSYKEGNVNGMSSYVIDGYLAFPLYFNKSTTLPRVGTSSGVISKLANECSFPVVQVDTTNDTQTWLPRNRRYNQFVNEICKSGYASKTSCMAIAINNFGAFKYLDLSRIVFDDFKDQKYVFGERVGESIQIYDAKVVSSTGANNTSGGYACTMHQQSVLSSVVNSVKTVQLVNMADTVSSNSVVKTLIDKSRFIFGPVDCGNVHTSSYEARYQNERIMGMYNNGIKILTPGVSPNEIADPCIVKYDTPDASANNTSTDQYSGRYVVKNKTLMVSGSNVFTRLDLMRNGFNADTSGVQS